VLSNHSYPVRRCSIFPPPVQPPVLIAQLKLRDRSAANELELKFFTPPRRDAISCEHFPCHFSQLVPDATRRSCTLPVSSSWHPCTGARAPLHSSRPVDVPVSVVRRSALRRRCAMNGRTRHKRPRTYPCERERERERGGGEESSQSVGRPSRASRAHKEGVPNFNAPLPPSSAIPCLCALSWPFFSAVKSARAHIPRSRMQPA